MKTLFQDFVTALSFLTIIPFPFQKSSEESSLARSMLFFPLIGFLIGGISLVLARFASPFFSPRFADLLLVLIPILLSGGLHIDGFADFADGFFGGRGKADILRIMKDSSIGVFGAAAVVFLVLIKWELISLLPFKTKTFLLALAAARWSQVLLSFFQPYAGAERGLGIAVAHKVQVRELAGTALLMLAAAVFLLGVQGLVILTAVAGFTFLIGKYFEMKIGGITGDLIGATSELTEILVLTSAILIFHQA